MHKYFFLTPLIQEAASYSEDDEDVPVVKISTATARVVLIRTQHVLAFVVRLWL